MPRKKIADETAEQPLKPSARKSKKEGAEAAKPRKKRALTVKESPAESPEVGFRFRSADITAEERPAPVERVKRKGDRREAR
ncbi:MAG TPA: hypothetical protein VFG65_05485, partial [Fimbriimonadales bacterium]|nr:hypothetical protein [Fimbriimonadales bacterium]